MLVHKPTPSYWDSGHWEERVSWRGYRYRVWSPAVPRINDELMKCVFYVYVSKDEALEGHPESATGFFFGVPSEYKKHAYYTYAITNKHVIQQIETPTLRVNLKEGALDILETKSDDWEPHLGSDLAICRIGISNDIHDVAFFHSDYLLTKEFIEEVNVGAGDDVFMIGNFQTRGGRKKNYPTARFGNIAQMPNEPMKNPHTGLDEESFIVEMRSTSGFSGSPVVLHIPGQSTRRFPSKEQQDREKDSPPRWHDIPPDYYRLLGIDWGHVRTKEYLYDREGKKMPESESVWINSAMAGVVPSWKLSEMLFSDEEIEIRKKADKSNEKTN